MSDIEKKIVDSIEPVVDAVVELEKKIGEIERTPGPAGKDSDPEQVADFLFEKYAERLRGAPGEMPEVEIDLDEVAEKIKIDKDFLFLVKGEDGKDGKDAEPLDPEIVAKTLATDYADVLRGEKGADGKDAEPIDIGAVSKALLDREDFLDLVKGARGERGEEGEPGVGIITKHWTDEIHREGTIVQHDIGRYYKALKDTATEPGRSDDWERVGSGGFRWTGVKKDGFDYENGDLYIDGGTTFIWWNGKGRMFSQRGQNGKEGKQGLKGEDAPFIVAAKADMSGIALVLSDGKVLDAPLEGVEKFIETMVEAKALTWVDMMQSYREDIDGPVIAYKGVFTTDKKYQRGDLVNFQKGLYLAIETPPKGPLDGQYWSKIAGMGGGGGGGGGQSGVPIPADQSYFQYLSWNPGTSNVVSPGAWMDGRELQEVVDIPDDLSDKQKLPESHLATGKLVYVRSEGMLYEYIADPTAATGTIDDWKPLVSGVTYVGRAGNLPTSAVNGQLFIITMDMAGEPLNRFVTWRDRGNIDVASVLSGQMPIQDGSSETLTVTFPSGAPNALENDKFIVELLFSDGTVVTREITVATGDTPDTVASKIQTALGQGVPQVTVTVANNVVTLAPTAGFDIDSFFTTASPAAGTRGGWVFVNRENWIKSQRSDPDQSSDRQEGDLQLTTESNARELKTFSEGSWQTVYSEQEVKSWIAAGSQFQGTVEEAGHGVAGALELDQLPDESTLSAGEKAHYWIWVGSPSHTLAAGSIGGAASAIDGASLSVGDWIIVAETGTGTGVFEYRVIPGDLMSRTVARQMFSMRPYAAGAWPEDSVVVYNGDVYRAPVGVQAGDPAPGATGSPWTKVDISGGLKVANADGDLPATAPGGQVWIVLSSSRAGGEQALYAYDHGAQQWQQLGGGGQPLDFTNSVELIGVGTPVGSVTAYAGVTLPAGWLLCDGGSFRQQDYPELYTVLGNRTTVPDLRRQFIRGGNLHDDHYSHHDDTTAMPRSGNAFRALANGGHSHAIRTVGDESLNGWVAGGAGGWMDTVQSPEAVLPVGDHVHAITGGDSETAPKHVVMAYIIKAVDRTVRLR